jgi:hypothetical protein
MFAGAVPNVSALEPSVGLERVFERVFEKLTLPLRSRAPLRDYGSHEHPMLRHRSQRPDQQPPPFILKRGVFLPTPYIRDLPPYVWLRISMGHDARPELALYRTYCVPSITALLDKTGEFYKRTQKRYDDTALIVAEIAKWGYESERGRQHGSSPALSSAAAPGSTFQELCSKKLFRIRASQQ